MTARLTPPTPATLRTYGLSFEDWLALVQLDGAVCAVCGRLPPSARLHIDHVHTPGWRQMDPEERRLFVRCLACSQCNRYVIGRSATLSKLRRAVAVFARPLPFGDEAQAS